MGVNHAAIRQKAIFRAMRIPADLARFVTALFQGMTLQAINGASRRDLLRLSDIALRIWPRYVRKPLHKTPIRSVN
jgi:hypothetical protein